MDKLIRLSDLKKIPIRAHDYDVEHGRLDFVLGIETALDYAEELPDAVVLCRDCHNAEPRGWTSDGAHFTYTCKRHDRIVVGDQFCSEGKKHNG